MPLTVTTREARKHSVHSPSDFERIFKMKYLSSIQFIDRKTQDRIEKRCAKALTKGWITPRQKWLGHYYGDGIRGTLPLDLRIDWIDEKIGYGVWTNREDRKSVV